MSAEKSDDESHTEWAMRMVREDAVRPLQDALQEAHLALQGVTGTSDWDNENLDTARAAIAAARRLR